MKKLVFSLNVANNHQLEAKEVRKIKILSSFSVLVKVVRVKKREAKTNIKIFQIEMKKILMKIVIQAASGVFHKHPWKISL